MLTRTKRTHCFNGHEFTEETIGVIPSTGRRYCRVCASLRVKTRRKTDISFVAHCTENMRKWRAANKERDQKNWTDLRRRKKEWLDSQKTPCIKCGESDIECLDFHHRDHMEKDATVSIAVAHWSIKRLKTEIAKCDILCSNCHRRLHAAERAATEGRVAILGTSLPSIVRPNRSSTHGPVSITR